MPVPRLPRVFVPRQRLCAELDVTSEVSLRVLVAPVGAGKTLGVSGWVRAASRGEQFRWISGDRSWSPQRLADLLDEPDSSPSGAPRPLVVVDDAHLLPSSTLHLVDERLATAPDRLRLLLLARYDLPFSRLGPELLGHFAVIRGDVLRMDDDEARALVAEHARTSSPEVLDAVNRHAQGWSAAIVLTARAVAASTDPVAAADAFAQGEASIAGRLSGEVFASLQPSERHVLLCLAGEVQVTTETAARLSHDADAGEVLASLESTGLLVSRLPEGWWPGDDESETSGSACYRIHPLMREIVRRRFVLGGPEVAHARRSIRRAVAVDITAGRPETAFARLVATAQPSVAAEVLASHGAQMLASGHADHLARFARRFGDVVQAHPEAWFVLALERWEQHDMDAAGRWLDLLASRAADDPACTVGIEHAVVRLLRARLGAEASAPAIEHAVSVLSQHLNRVDPQPLVPLLATELGYAHSWAGQLDESEVHLTTAAAVSAARGATVLQATALSHLAMTLHMQGRESASADVAREALEVLDGAAASHPSIAARAHLARELARRNDVPRDSCRDEVEPARVVHVGDPVAQFWHRILDTRRALAGRAVSEAAQVLQLPSWAWSPSDHMQVILLVETGYLASVAGDDSALAPVEEKLEALGAHGEAALIAGLRHELGGDRKAAAAAYADAAARASYVQPACRAFALTARAQLLDVLGDHPAALACLLEAATITEVRRNAVPFLGWSRQGTPIGTLLSGLEDGTCTPWIQELAESARASSDIVSALAPVTAAPRERSRATDSVVRPSLSSREREVLNELARGATYADIAASLFVSENTVKTHVSSLYGKLAARRRSEALAVARNLHLL